ncbi:Hypothetical_protein [Hexamita inflata]|uniref:Hypothetical_protein n=1 Tax=Hexamita inflata TaxID=28002 RepID=A0AA86VF78_9EUKA|nr:Hypothetical protein HINF_LOCUS52653 [Hexamita inflata]
MLHFYSLTKYGVVRIYQIKEQKLIKQMNYKGYHKQNKVVGKQDQTRYLTNKLWKSIVYSSFVLCSICDSVPSLLVRLYRTFCVSFLIVNIDIKNDINIDCKKVFQNVEKQISQTLVHV